MTTAAIIRLVLLIFAGILLLLAFRSLFRGLRSRSDVNRQYFNVGRLEARRQVFANMLSTVGLVLLALVFAIGAAVIPDDLFKADPTAEFTEESESTVEGAVAEIDVDEVAESSPEEETEAIPIEAEGGAMGDDSGVAEEDVEPTPVPTETPIPTPELETVYVDSPIVGLYIRDLPEGDIIDVLDDQSPLSLLDEREDVNGTLWIKVITADGREGWVAEQFTTEIPPTAAPADSEG